MAIQGEGRRGSSSQSSRVMEDTSAAYPPPTSSIAFPDDPFSDPSRPSASQQVHRPVNADTLADWARSTRFAVLNHFSQVTNVARNGAHTLLSSPLFQQRLDGSVDGSGSAAYDDATQRSSGVSLATSLLQHGPVGPFGPNAPTWRQSDLAQKSGTADFDSAHVYLARWAKLMAEEGEANRKHEAEARRANYRAAMDVEESEVGTFEVLERLPHADRPETTRSRDNAISLEAWQSLFDETGHPEISSSQMRALVFQQGFGKAKQHARSGVYWDQLSARAECWSFLLGAQQWSRREGREDRRRAWKAKSEEYWELKTKNLERIQPEASGSNSAGKSQRNSVSSNGSTEEEKDDAQALFWKEQRHRIHVDCRRVDRKVPFFRDTEVIRIENGKEAIAGEGDGLDANAHIHRLEEILLTYVAWDQEREASEEYTAGDGNGKDERGLLGGYVQGMSDLCAPLYAVADGDEAKTFWLFVGLMRRLRQNFYNDQSGMRMQLLCLQKLIAVMDPTLYAHFERTESLNLFFCFRWLLVCFKREFGFDETLILWEAIWAAELDANENGKTSDGAADSDATSSDADLACTRQTNLSNHFQIFIALSVLQQQRDVVTKYLQNFDEILQYMNGLSGQLDVDLTIGEAQIYCLALRKLVELHDENKSILNEHIEADGDAGAPVVTVDNDLRLLIGASPLREAGAQRQESKEES